MAPVGDHLRAWAASAWPARKWTRSKVIFGAFHQVLLCESDVAARIAKGTGHQQRVEREALAARRVAALGLPFAVPQPIGDPVTHLARTGLLTTFVPGQVKTTSDWADLRDTVTDVLGAFRNVPADKSTALPPPRSWCGGNRWLDLVHDRLVDRLPARVRKSASRVATDVLAVETGTERGFVHGDLGLHNMLWSGRHLHGLIDLDHACWGDPAIDIAPLVATFGASRISEIAAPAVLDRAMYNRASLPLQVASAAELIGDHALRDHALRNFTTRFTEGTLYDPDHARPSA